MHGAQGIGRDGLALRLVEVARLHGEDAPRGIDDGCIAKVRGDARGIEGGRHDEDLEIVAKAALDVEREGEAEIGVERAFVEFVEDDEAGAGELRILLQAARQDALGDDLDPRPGRDAALEAHGVAHRAAHLLAQRLRHAMRGVARCKAAGLQHDDLLALEPWRIDELQGHPRGLAGTRLGHEQGRRPRGEGVRELRNDEVDGEVHGRINSAGAAGMSTH